MRLFRPVVTAYAHCDLPCGVYDPAQARIEAESVKAIMEKYQGNDDPVFRTRALHHQGAAGRARQASPVGAVDGLLQAAALREVPAAARAVQQGDQGGRARRRQGFGRPGRGPGAARPDRRDRHDLLGDQEGVTPDASMKAGSALEPAFLVPPGLTDAQLWLIRHGETEWSRSGQHTSRHRPPAHRNGERQATALRGLLAELHPVLVLCSPRRRALRTAELAGLTVDAIDDDLVEWNYGKLRRPHHRTDPTGRPGLDAVDASAAGRRDGGPGRGPRRPGPGTGCGAAPGRPGRARRARAHQPGPRRSLDRPADRSTVRGWRWTRPRHPSLGTEHDIPVIHQWNMPNPAVRRKEHMTE